MRDSYEALPWITDYIVPCFTIWLHSGDEELPIYKLWPTSGERISLNRSVGISHTYSESVAYRRRSSWLPQYEYIRTSAVWIYESSCCVTASAWRRGDFLWRKRNNFYATRVGVLWRGRDFFVSLSGGRMKYCSGIATDHIWDGREIFEENLLRDYDTDTMWIRNLYRVNNNVLYCGRMHFSVSGRTYAWVRLQCGRKI